MDKQAEFLTWLMAQTSLSQVELAQRLGISASLVSRLLRGERRLTLAMLRQIASTFALPQTEVFSRVGVLEEPTILCNDSLQAPVAWPVSEEDDVRVLQDQLNALRDPRRALAWSLEGKVPQRTIEKLTRLVELELEYHDNPKEG
ncbi:MAG: helix-turn-helix transcriptional regulator [Steroidobacteraceae bacterium]|nr:helix-turn-helix transcriptional regulator [Steroidobacteraceae bacterium]